MGNRQGSLIYRLTHRKHRSSRSRLPNEPTSPTDKTHLETFLLVWLDPHVDTSKENIRTQKRLRKILTCLIVFDDVEACQQWFEKCCVDEKIILIVSGAFGEEIVPRIHDLPTIISIYVYCLDVNRNEIWAKDHPKIRSVQSSTNILLEQLSHNQINLENVEDSKALKIYKQEEEEVHSLDTKTASLIWYQLLLESLIVPGYIQSKGTFHELTEILRQYSSGNEDGLQLIDEFEQTYKPKRALLWLTRDTPLARFVNKALREQDINIIFALRFLLVDIHTQLIEHQAQSLNVFKVQLMSTSQMEELKANPGQLLIIHGFLFTSTNISQLMSTITNNDQFETVLFDIEADFRPGVAPFAFLRNIDSNIVEQIDREVLFMCGSIFQVGPLICENSIWKLRLRLASENDISILYNMKQKLKDNQNLNIIRDLLNQCHQGKKATIYSERVQYELSELPSTTSTSNKQMTKKNSKSNSISVPDTLFILVNLSQHMTEFTSAILKTLHSFASKVLLIINDESTIDFSQWSKTSTTIFTTAQFASSIENLPKYSKIFLLDKDNTNTEQQRFGTIDDLICQLVNEIMEKYQLEASEYTKAGELIKAKELDKYAQQIFRELRQIHDQFLTNQSPLKTSDDIPPILVWLISDPKDTKDMDYIKEIFGKYFSSDRIFSNESDFHEYIAKEDTIDVFLIICTSYRESIAKNLRSSGQFPHVKHVYRYGESKKAEDEQIITNEDDLRYHLTYDLIDYYGKLGELYRTNNQKKKARAMFSKAQALCNFLSTTCFPSE